MKSYTDINQSKKLAEILPIESADMDYIPIVNYDGKYSIIVNEWDNDHVTEEGWIPCWSLAALINALPQDTVSLTGNCKEPYWLCEYVDSNDKSYIGEGADTPIDSCYKLILKLHELNLL